jgi:hypothetical protein
MRNLHIFAALSLLTGPTFALSHGCIASSSEEAPPSTLSIAVSQTPTGSPVASPAVPTASHAALSPVQPDLSSTTSSQAPVLSSAKALSLETPSPTPVSKVGTLDAALILQIMPGASSCNNAPFPAECRTAEQAAPFINAAFNRYMINSKAAQAATLALQALETGELKYDHSHFPAPGIPGKGTRNMQSPEFNKEYATAVVGADKVQAAGSPDAVLALVNGDAESFASASWFLATKCPDILTQFTTSPDAAWTAYLGPGCIGTTDSDDREQYWTVAKKALGLS